MSKIYYVKEEKHKFQKALDKLPYTTEETRYIRHQIKLKKIYHNIHNLLLLSFPDVLADLINDYMTEIIVLNISVNVNSAYPEKKLLIIIIIIESHDVVIEFNKYNFAFQYEYYVNYNTKYSLGCRIESILDEKITTIKNNVIDYDYELLLLFNFYMCKLYKKKEYMNYTSIAYTYGHYKCELNNKLITVNYKYKSNSCVIVNHAKILDHKKLKNTIIILYIIINTINKSLQRYYDDANLNVFYKIHKQNNESLYL